MANFADCDNWLIKFNNKKNKNSQELGDFFLEFAGVFKNRNNGLSLLIAELGVAIQNLTNFSKLNGEYGSGIKDGVSNSSINIAKKITGKQQGISRKVLLRVMVERLCRIKNVNVAMKNVNATPSKSNDLNSKINALLQYINKYDKELEGRIKEVLNKKTTNMDAVRRYLASKGVTNAITNTNSLNKALSQLGKGERSNINVLRSLFRNYTQGKVSNQELNKIGNFNAFLQALNKFRKPTNVPIETNNEAAKLRAAEYKGVLNEINKLSANLTSNQHKKLGEYKKIIAPKKNNIENLGRFFQNIRGRPQIYVFVNKMMNNTMPSYINTKLKEMQRMNARIIKGNANNAPAASTEQLKGILETLDNGPKNIFFTGPSGSGKTTLFEGFIKSKTSNYTNTTDVKVYKPKFFYDSNSGNLTITDECDKMKLSKFKDTYIKETIFNPQSSRAHMFVEIGNCCIFDLAGTENPIKIMKDTLGFNIFSTDFWQFSNTTFKSSINNEVYGFKYMLVCFFVRRENPATIKNVTNEVMKNHLLKLYKDESSLDVLLTKVIFWSFFTQKRLNNEAASFLKGGIFKMFNNISNIENHDVKVKINKMFAAIEKMKEMSIQEKINIMSNKNTTDPTKKAIKFFILSETIKRCFEGFYIMRTLHSLKTLFMNYDSYNKMVLANKNTIHNKIKVNSLNTENSFILPLAKIEGAKISPTPTTKQLAAGANANKNGLFTIANLRPNASKRYPTNFLDFLMRRKAQNIMIGVVPGDLKKNQTNLENLKIKQVGQTLDYFKFLQS